MSIYSSKTTGKSDLSTEDENISEILSKNRRNCPRFLLAKKTAYKALNGEAAFAYSLTGPQYSLGSNTSLACPRRYSIPVTPGTLAKATPSPTQINTSYSFGFGNHPSISN